MATAWDGRSYIEPLSWDPAETRIMSFTLQVSDPNALQAKLQDDNTLSTIQNALNQNGVCSACLPLQLAGSVQYAF